MDKSIFTNTSFLNILLPALSAILSSVLTFLATNKKTKNDNDTQLDSLYITNVSNIIETYKGDLKDAREQLDAKNNENFCLKERNIALEHRIEDLEKENKEKDLEIASLKKENRSLKNEIKSHKN